MQTFPTFGLVEVVYEGKEAMTGNGDELIIYLKTVFIMNFQGKAAGWVFLITLLLTAACRETHKIAPDYSADRSARAMSDTVITDTSGTGTVPEPEKPAEVPPVTTDTSDTKAPGETLGEPTFLSMENEGFTITPYVLDSLNGDGISLVFTSDHTFECLDSYLSVYRTDHSAAAVEIVIGTLTLPYNCNPGLKKAIREVVVYPLQDGAYPLRIRSGEAVSEGKITRAGSRYTIDWPEGNLLRFTQKELSF